MNNKYVIAVAVVVTIAIVAVSGVIFFGGEPAHITITGANDSIWHGTQYVTNGNNTHIDASYNGMVTYVIFHFNLDTTKNTQLDLADCSLTINGQTPPILYTDNGLINLQSGEVNECSATFYVEGIFENGFQLNYNGTADVEIT